MNPVPEFACSAEALDKLEAALAEAPQVPSQPRLAALLPLAWQLRQRDTTRALALADQAEACLAVTDLAADARLGIAARLCLIRGEASWLRGQSDAGAALAASALRDFTACNDAIGCADVHWLLAYIAYDQGDPARWDTELAAMAACAESADPERVTIAQAWRAVLVAFRDIAAARRDWGLKFATDSADRHPAASAWVEVFSAISARHGGEYVNAIRHFAACHTLALATGQIRLATLAATSLGASFNSLNDYHAALEWMQRGLELARPRAWPASLGIALTQTAETLRLLQRLDAAHDLLREAMALMATQASSQNYAVALSYRGDVALDLRQYQDALASFQLLEQRGHALDRGDLLCRALRGQARALLELDLAQAALAQAHAALHAASSGAKDQIDALRVLADIHARHPLAPPPDMRAANAALHYLQQAHNLATTITGFAIPGDLLEALAEQHAKTGNFEQAYHLAKQAIAAHAKIHSNEAANRASALQASHETQRAWAEGEHHRKLAAAHAARADALEQANSTLEELGAVGRGITANLEAHAIFSALDTHVHALLDVTSFLIFQLEPDGEKLRMVYGVEAGQPLPSHSLRLDEHERPAVRCARERSAMVIERVAGSGGTIPGTLETLCLMYAPLMVGERLLGVMTIQSVQPQAYHARETAIFSTLCAYAAIALANAESQAQMVQHEENGVARATGGQCRTRDQYPDWRGQGQRGTDRGRAGGLAEQPAAPVPGTRLRSASAVPANRSSSPAADRYPHQPRRAQPGQANHRTTGRAGYP